MLVSGILIPLRPTDRPEPNEQSLAPPAVKTIVCNASPGCKNISKNNRHSKSDAISPVVPSCPCPVKHRIYWRASVTWWLSLEVEILTVMRQGVSTSMQRDVASSRARCASTTGWQVRWIFSQRTMICPGALAFVDGYRRQNSCECQDSPICLRR